MEVGYNTTVGPAALAIGYGSYRQRAQTGDGTGDGEGYSMTDIEVAIDLQFLIELNSRL